VVMRRRDRHSMASSSLQLLHALAKHHGYTAMPTEQFIQQLKACEAARIELQRARDEIADLKADEEWHTEMSDIP
jgi:hypothetical protein